MVGLWPAVVAGLAGGVLAAAAVAGGLFTGGIPAVALALWDRWLRLVPMPLFSLLLGTLKFAAKPAAFWAMLAALSLGLGGLGALIARWTSGPARALAAAWLSASALLALLAWPPATSHLAARLEAQGVDGRPGLTVGLALAGYGGVFAVPYAAALRILLRRRRARLRPVSGGSCSITRRHLLARGMMALLASALGTGGAQWLRGRWKKVWAATLNAFARVTGLPPEITPTGQFYVVSKNPPGLDPVLDARRWSLEVTGLVGRTVKLTYDELRALPAVQQYQTLECISNEVGGDLISNAAWKGARLRDVLMLAGGPAPTAVKVAFRCADGYTESLPIADALNPTTLLAYEMNGEPLPPRHGFPVRLLVPGLFGMKNPKWITRIEVVNYDFRGYWEASGWSDEAVVKTMSKFTTPTRSSLPAGEVGLGGVAYAGDRGIRKVEYSTDGGRTWQQAETAPPLGPFTWVLWAAVWTPAGPGEYVLKVRATDGTGVLQAARESPPLPDGATGYHTLRIRIRR
ncbi:MAG: molybdopterin-dependent oxidoreductase [Armatimonadota bacterium]|nr:molybdopterin-dependent oxidoreductase [Armatimonadota bacterium]MDR7561427.1 molybdopterin-dependent oxidoreductase [Armatimonadota bacterium]MDR7588467.1 molybdopterin-dependent oxidoreductase [Armatimonadota bacterium]